MCKITDAETVFFFLCDCDRKKKGWFSRNLWEQVQQDQYLIFEVIKFLQKNPIHQKDLHMYSSNF